MQNLKNIEENYNAHVKAYDRAYSNNQEYRVEYETGYMYGVEYVLNQLGIAYEIDTFGHIAIKQEA